MISRDKRLISLLLVAILISIYGGSTVLASIIDFTVDIYRHPYNNIYGSNNLYGTHSSTTSSTNSNTSIYGSGTVDIIGHVTATSSNDIYNSTVSMTIRDSSGYIYSNYDYINGWSAVSGSVYGRTDKRVITLPGNDFYKLDAVVTGQNGETRTVTKEFDIRAVSSVPQNINANFSVINENYVYSKWTPLRDADRYTIYLSHNKGLSENYAYSYNSSGYDNCSFFVPKDFYEYDKWYLYAVAYKGDMRIGRSQEVAISTRTDSIITFNDKNLELVVRETIHKPIGDIYKSDVENITYLNAYRRGIVDLNGIQYLRNLVILDLSRNQISDIRPICTLTKLRGLYMNENKISDIRPISTLTTLQSLSLGFNQISDISSISALVKLDDVFMVRNQISDIRPIGTLTNMQYLSLDANRISDISPISTLTKLKSLSLRDNQISEISIVSGLTNLQALDLNNNKITNIESLRMLKELTFLAISNNQIHTTNVVSELTKLEGLMLGSNPINDITPLQSLENLKSLWLEYIDIKDISVLSNLRSLEYLSLYGNKISDIKALESCKKLRSLNLSENNITDISPLQNLQNLNELYLRGNPITDYSYVASYYSNLTYKDFTLDLSRNYGISLDGKSVASEVYTYKYNGELLVGVRSIAESLGLEVSYDNAAKQISLSAKNKELVLNIGKTEYAFNKVPGNMSVPVIIMNGYTLVPAKFIAECYGYKINIDENTKTIKFSSPAIQPTAIPTSPPATNSYVPIVGGSSISSLSSPSPSSTPVPTATDVPSSAKPVVTAEPTVVPAPVNEDVKEIPSAGGFKDILTHWAKGSIGRLVEMGIVSGYADNTIKPNSEISRAEFAVMIIKAAGYEPSKSPKLDFEDNKDIPSWAKGYIQTAIDKGIIKGYPDNTFKAANKISRKEMVVMIAKAFGYNPSSNQELGLGNFKDNKDIPLWAQSYIQTAVEKGIIKGYQDQTLKPNRIVTRAEAFTVVEQCLSLQKPQ